MLDFKFDVWDNLVVQGAAIAQAFSPVLVSNQLGVFSDAQLVFKGAGDNEFIVRAPQVDLAAQSRDQVRPSAGRHRRTIASSWISEETNRHSIV